MTKNILALAALWTSALFGQSQLTITTPNALPPATVGQRYAVQLAASGGATPYAWSFQSGGNPSARFSISSSGLLSGTPTTSDLGTLTFVVQVQDATGYGVTKQVTTTVLATQPLSLDTTAFSPAVTGAAYSFQLSASGGTPPYTWAVQPAIVTFPVPGQVSPGLTLDSKTGLVTGTPTSTGSFDFTITLTDGANGSVSKPFTLTVTAGGPLGIVTTTMPNGTVGASYKLPLQGRGGTPPYIWSITSGTLPRGLTLDNENDQIIGVPLDAGTTQFILTATDHASPANTARQPLSVTVVTPPALTISTNTLPNATQGAPYSHKIAASGGIPPYSWRLASGTLPAGINLLPSDGVLEGIPSAVASSTFTVELTDSASPTPARATMFLGLTVAKLTQISLANQTLPRGTVGTPYSAVLEANGGAAPYSWTVLTGTLPPGLYLNTAGTLSGVPATAGDFGFTVQATDASGAKATAVASVSFSAAPLSIVPMTLPSGVAGTPYPPQILDATGGIPPYTFALEGSPNSGLLPLNGTIAGTPTSAGTSNLTVRVTDAAKTTATSTLQLVVRPAEPTDIVLSAGSLAFNLNTGSSELPEPKSFSIASSNVSTQLGYQISVSPAAPWLTLSGNASGSTPNVITVALNSQALSLAPSANPYSTVITVTCAGQNACSGNAQKINVSLTVKTAPPQLLLTSSVLALAPPPAGGGGTTGVFGIANAGGGSISVISIVPSAPWLTVENVPSTVAAGVPVYVTVRGTPQQGYTTGYLRGSLTVNTTAGSARLPVTLLLSNTPFLSLNPAAQQFPMAAGGAVGNPNGTIQVLVSGTTSASWTATVQPSAPWLTVQTPTGTSTPTTPGVVSYSIDPTISAALGAGNYYGRIRVASGQTGNAAQEFIVVLNVAPAGTPPAPQPSPSGLLFISNGTSTTPSQNLTLFASSVTPVPYQAFASTASGANWLTVSPTSGFASASTPGRPVVSVNPAGLAPGIYRGTVTYQFSAAALRSVNVTYIIPPLVSTSPFLQGGGADAARLQPRATCTPAKLIATSTGLVTNFNQPAAWPTVLAVTLTDDCGTPVPNGSVDVTFSSGEPPVGLRADASTPGRYSGTWVPRSAASQITVNAFASAPGLAPARMQIVGKVAPNVAPALNPGGMLNVFNPAVGAGIAPGTAVQIYGTNLAPEGTSNLASSLPFPTNLSGTSVLLGGVQAPLYYVSPGQINALAPFELTPGVPYQVLVTTGGAITTPDQFTVTPGSPGIAAFPNGSIIAVHLDNSLVTDASPAKPGEIVVLYLAGLGSSQNQPPTGSGAPVPPTEPTNPITLELGGKTVPTLFVGLTPGAVGLYQINFTVPADTPDGNPQLTVSQAGTSSNVTIFPVRK